MAKTTIWNCASFHGVDIANSTDCCQHCNTDWNALWDLLNRQISLNRYQGTVPSDSYKVGSRVYRMKGHVHRDTTLVAQGFLHRRVNRRQLYMSTLPPPFLHSDPKGHSGGLCDVFKHPLIGGNACRQYRHHTREGI